MNAIETFFYKMYKFVSVFEKNVCSADRVLKELSVWKRNLKERCFSC